MHPELAVVTPSNDDAAPIRIRDLLSMSAGLGDRRRLGRSSSRHNTDDELESESAGRGHAVRRTARGGTYQYSNLGYGLIGRVVKRATGRHVQDLISERFLGPLGMARSTWVMQPITMTGPRPFAELDGRAVADDGPLGDGEIAPMGGIWTTVADLSTWVRRGSTMRSLHGRGPILGGAVSRASGASCSRCTATSGSRQWETARSAPATGTACTSATTHAPEGS